MWCVLWNAPLLQGGPSASRLPQGRAGTEVSVQEDAMVTACWDAACSWLAFQNALEAVGLSSTSCS